MKRVLTILAIFIGCGIASAQEFEKTLVVYYHTGSAWYLPQLRDNNMRTKEFFKELNELQSMPDVKITSFEMIGSCSPDGTQEYNDFLGNRRTMLFYERFSKELNYPISKILFRNESENWSKVAKYTAADRSIALRKEAVDEILKGGSGIVQRLKSLDYGRTYQEISEKIFPEVRTVTVKVTFGSPQQPAKQTKIKEVITEVQEMTKVDDALYEKPKKPRTYSSKSYIDCAVKTNAAAWLIGVSNVALEFPIAQNMTVNFPVYFSGWDTSYLTFNFKGLVLMPELRYYMPQVDGLYLGAHAGLAWFNYYNNGDFRYQNTGWNTPSYGGGVNVGYRMPLKKNSPWDIEFGIGAGIYDVTYDIFYNEANGPFVARNQFSTYYGIDQAQISVIYKLGKGRKEGR